MKKIDTVLLATRNKGKTQEFTSFFASFPVHVASIEDFPDILEVEETGSTFMENALLKALTVAKASGFVAIADDSGLEVDALNKAPGIYSARYSAEPNKPATDERNINKLLSNLSTVPATNRTGRFQCCIAAATPDGVTITANGSWEGYILEQPKGKNGFGYDPIFFDPAVGMSAAEMESDQKNLRSHRAKATRKLLQKWPDFWHEWYKNNR